MSDLSRLLDDVYGDPGTSSEPDRATPPHDASPEPDPSGWDPDEASDDTFVGWAADVTGDDSLLGWTSDRAVPGAEGDLDSPTEQLAVVPPSLDEPVAAAWQRADDDILPGNRAKGVRRGRRRTAATPVEAPTIEAFAAESTDDEVRGPAGRFGRLGRRTR